MYTRCPECQTTFRISPRDLSAARGRVRCGHCDEVFNALEHLIGAAPEGEAKPSARDRGPGGEPGDASDDLDDRGTPAFIQAGPGEETLAAAEPDEADDQPEPTDSDDAEVGTESGEPRDQQAPSPGEEAGNGEDDETPADIEATGNRELDEELLESSGLLERPPFAEAYEGEAITGTGPDTADEAPETSAVSDSARPTRGTGQSGPDGEDDHPVEKPPESHEDFELVSQTPADAEQAFERQEQNRRAEDLPSVEEDPWSGLLFDDDHGIPEAGSEEEAESAAVTPDAAEQEGAEEGWAERTVHAVAKGIIEAALADARALPAGGLPDSDSPSLNEKIDLSAFGEPWPELLPDHEAEPESREEDRVESPTDGGDTTSGEAAEGREDAVPAEEEIDMALLAATRELAAEADIPSDGTDIEEDTTADTSDEDVAVAAFDGSATFVLEDDTSEVAELDAMAPTASGVVSKSPDKDIATALPPFVAPKRKLWRTLLLALGSLGLLLVLAAQLVDYRKEDLLAHPVLGPRLQHVYGWFGVPAAPPVDLAAFDLRQLGGAMPPEDPGSIVIRVSLRNTADRAQPYPIIRLILEDRWGQVLGMRDVAPADYADLASPDQAELNPGQHVLADIAVVDPPGGTASNFRIDACVREPSGGIRCANEP